jgi:hypothetical protein
MATARVFDVDRDAGTPEEISGADVVVVRSEQAGEWADRIRVRAPNSVVVVIGESPETVCEVTLFPRARIIGVSSADEASAVVDAVVNDLNKEVKAVVRCEGERGIEGEFARVPVRIGARGVVGIVE